MKNRGDCKRCVAPIVETTPGEEMKMKNSVTKPASYFPVFSMLMGIVAAIVFWMNKTGQILQYDRLAIADGEFWRLITGHWTHWSFEHFLWCTIVFVTLGGICEHFSRKAYVALLMASSVLIPIFAWYAEPDMDSYRGLSGLCSSLFVFSAVWVMRIKYSSKDWPGFIVSVLAGATFIAKIVFEYVSGSAVFADASELFTPVPFVHLVGGIVGALMVVIFWRKTENDL